MDHVAMWRKHKRIKHYAAEGEARELTFSCYQRAPVFIVPECCLLLSKWIDKALTVLSYDLLAFVYMPDHVHLLVLPRGDGGDIDRLLLRIKQRSAMAIHDQLIRAGEEDLLGRLQYVDRAGEHRFRLWQAGPGYDRNVDKTKVLDAMVEYIHNNPVRKGLCAYPDEYTWSSWRQVHAPGTDDPRVPKVSWPDNLIL